MRDSTCPNGFKCTELLFLVRQFDVSLNARSLSGLWLQFVSRNPTRYMLGGSISPDVLFSCIISSPSPVPTVKMHSLVDGIICKGNSFN